MLTNANKTVALSACTALVLAACGDGSAERSDAAVTSDAAALADAVVTSDGMLYGRIARGSKAGGMNVGGFPHFDEERVTRLSNRQLSHPSVRAYPPVGPGGWRNGPLREEHVRFSLPKELRSLQTAGE